MTVIKKKSSSTARAAEPGVRFHCDVCSADISSTVRIRCADPACQEYDLCVSCFTEGKSSSTHKPATHAYCVIEQHSIPVFDKDWGADEELLLLEGIEMYGLGSWADIADHIGGGREKDEVRDHYLNTYIFSSKFPLPELVDPEDTGGFDEIPRDEFQARKKRRIEDKKAKAANLLTLPPKKKPTASVPACHEVQGYMPGRVEFEVEHENEAETTVKDMFFDPGDGVNHVTGVLEPEIELKLTVMDTYNHRLTLRAERKKVIFEHSLLEYRKNQALEKKRSKEEKDLLNKAKPFGRIMNRDDFVEFVDDLQKELSLKQAITTLQEWRRSGIVALEAGTKYELEKVQRSNILKSTMMPVDRLAHHRLSAKATPPMETPVLSSPHLLNPGPLNNIQITVSNPTSAPISAASISSVPHITPPPSSNGTSTKDLPSAPAAPNKPNAVSAVLNAPMPWPPLTLSSETTSDLHHLTDEEKTLCSMLRIQPKPYLCLKESLLREAMRQGGILKKKQSREICRIDTNKISKIHDFFVSSGWIGKA